MTGCYDLIIGTGGIGTGLLFITDENRTLGRNESRLVRLSAAKDYCKQHIVLYYSAALLADKARVCPIGCVGQDAYGHALLDEMKRSGMDTEYVECLDNLPTTISFCLQYPDKDGCNITADNGASGAVSASQVTQALENLRPDQRSIALALPEVSIDARLAMLKQAKARGAYCVLSVPEAEAKSFIDAGAFADCDLLAVNEREAVALVSTELYDQALVRTLYEKIASVNPTISLLVTCGKAGAYTAQNGNVEFVPSLNAKVVNTTGAGDAFLGSLVAGLALGLPLQKGCSDEKFAQSPLKSAAELGALCAGMAIQSEDSIAYTVTRKVVADYIAANCWRQTNEFEQIGL